MYKGEKSHEDTTGSLSRELIINYVELLGDSRETNQIYSGLH